MRVDDALVLARSADIEAAPRAARASPARLAAELVAFEIKKSAAGTVLGVAWAVVQPLLFVGSYWFLLSVLGARRPGSGGTEARLVILLAGLVPWLYFSRATAAGLRSIPAHANLIKQIAFPTSVLPFVAVGVPAVDFAVGAVVLALAAALAGVASWTLLLLVPAMLLLTSALVALASLLAPLAVMLPDVRRAAQIALRAGLFITPVLFLPSALPSRAEVVAYVNPMAYFISLIRFAATGSREVFVTSLGTDAAVAVGFTCALIVVAYAVHRRSWRTVVDHV